MKILNKILCFLEIHNWHYDDLKKRKCKCCNKKQLKLMVNEDWRQVYNENGWKYW